MTAVMTTPESNAGAETRPVKRRAIENDDFPVEYLSTAATAESWRKEINRPIYHLHKWWAQRLGSVFRGIVLGAALPEGADVRTAFASATRLPGLVVFDPLMGSGTTVGETLKLGARAVGRDINPVSVRSVRAALQTHDKVRATQDFAHIAAAVGMKIRDLYRVTVEGTPAEVLYYFWVATTTCPHCASTADLFSSHIFARHAYPGRYPAAQAVCPQCGAINPCRADDAEITCKGCSQCFPAVGPARGAKATCGHCGTSFRVLEAVNAYGGPLRYRQYAKLVLMPDGTKRYVRTDDVDVAGVSSAEQMLRDMERPYPIAVIEHGYNTNQAMRYGFTHWHHFFNPRQLLALALLSDVIRDVPLGPSQDLFTVLFSGALEFNTMFASYKGEGTGAVRHMFSHHILKPERMPIEANVWGTPKSSGSFSGLFRSRVLRCLEYAADPFELVPSGVGNRTERVYGLSEPLGHHVAGSWREFTETQARCYLSSGPSQETDLEDRSVDLVVTDPPFFDNVHYSELADFFRVWQCHIDGTDPETTRSPAEIQHTEATEFAHRLGEVFRETHRVLKDDGLLVFTYHHSRLQGWTSVLAALQEGGYRVVATHPVKSEMTVATPKSQAREPISIDLIIVCRKADTLSEEPPSYDDLQERANRQVARMTGAGHHIGPGDERVIRLGATLPLLTTVSPVEAKAMLDQLATGSREQNEGLTT